MSTPVAFSPFTTYRNVDLRTSKPLSRINKEPNYHKQHWSTIDQTGPVHQLQRQVVTPYSWETQNRHHDEDEADGKNARRQAEPSKMPRPPTELIANDESLDTNWHRESDVRCDRADGEDSTDSYATKDEKIQKDANGCVKPDSIDWGQRMSVHFLQWARERAEAVVAGVSEANSGRRNHTLEVSKSAIPPSKTTHHDFGSIFHCFRTQKPRNR